MDEFDAYEEQLAFFGGKQEYKEIYKNIQGAYIRAINYSYFMEQESDLPIEDKEYYAKILQKKMRRALVKYGRTSGISFKTDKGVYDTAYPAFMQAYWFVRSRLDKLKRG